MLFRRSRVAGLGGGELSVIARLPGRAHVLFGLWREVVIGAVNAALHEPFHAALHALADFLLRDAEHFAGGGMKRLDALMDVRFDPHDLSVA